MSITDKAIIMFLKVNILPRFGALKALISNNGTQFNNGCMKKFCTEIGIEQRFASIAHPHTNGHAGVTNHTILNGMCTRVQALGGHWIEELDNVLWTYRTTSRASTGETLFNLVYGTKVVAPVETVVTTFRVKTFNEELNDASRSEDLDALEERRLKAANNIHKAKMATSKLFNGRVKARSFHVGELVLRRNEFIGQDMLNKLWPKWERPYKVRATPQPNAYVLEDMDGRPLAITFSGAKLTKLSVYSPLYSLQIL